MRRWILYLLPSIQRCTPCEKGSCARTRILFRGEPRRKGVLSSAPGGFLLSSLKTLTHAHRLVTMSFPCPQVIAVFTIRSSPAHRISANILKNATPVDNHAVPRICSVAHKYGLGNGSIIFRFYGNSASPWLTEISHCAMSSLATVSIVKNRSQESCPRRV